MGVRASHSRPAKTYKYRTINGIGVMFTWDSFGTVSDGRIAYIVRKAEQGKLQIPAGKTLVHIRADGTLGFGTPGDRLDTPEMEAAAAARREEKAAREKLHTETLETTASLMA